MPVALQYQINEQIKAAVRTLFGGPTSKFSDSYRGGLGVVGAFAVSPMIDIFASFDFTNLYGKNSKADFRQLVVGAAIKL